MLSSPKIRIFTQKKGNFFLQILFYSIASFPAVCFECSLHRWHPQKAKGSSSPNDSVSGFIIYYITGCKWSSPRQFIIKFGLGSSVRGFQIVIEDCVKFHLNSQLRFYDDSVSEIINTMSETTGEKEQFKERVMASSQNANAKFGK